MNFYNNRSKFKIYIILVSLLIGAVSLWYTNQLVNQLAEREKKLIDLFAKSYKVIAASDYSENQSFLFMEIIEANNSIPVILTDEHNNYINYRNLSVPSHLDDKGVEQFIKAQIEDMRAQYEPIVIEAAGFKQFIYYKNSFLLSQLKYYPYIQLTIINILALIAYLAFSYSRRAEQNRVWVGLAKETAHQLGTPLSSLMAWVEYLKTDDRMKDDEIIIELEKDIHRLEMITSRFSNIGSVPALREENVLNAVGETVSYLQKRVSQKVRISLKAQDDNTDVEAKINKPLFGWVIENLIKNAVDAMGGIGTIDIVVTEKPEGIVQIDITDSGKGMTKAQAKMVFEPGFTTKKRGWGLGLTLAKRIIENYHQGKIWVKRTEPGKGTTFRIILVQKL